VSHVDETGDLLGRKCFVASLKAVVRSDTLLRLRAYHLSGHQVGDARLRHEFLAGGFGRGKPFSLLFLREVAASDDLSDFIVEPGLAFLSDALATSVCQEEFLFHCFRRSFCVRHVLVSSKRVFKIVLVTLADIFGDEAAAVHDNV